MLVDAAVGFARDGGTDDIGYSEDFVALALGFAECGERVDGFAGLAHHEEERVAEERRVTVAKLGGVVAFHGNSGEALDHLLRDSASVQGGAAGAEHETLNAAELAGRNIEATKVGRGTVFGETATQGVFEGNRLLENFLLPEVGVGAHVGVGDIPRDPVDGRVDRLPDRAW